MNQLQLRIKSLLPSLPLTRPDLRQSVVHHLGELLTILQHVSQEGIPPSVESNPQWWEDEDYLYLQFASLNQPAPELDLNVHDGTVFIRVEK